ncbi:hypothetical protein AC249_AIPGENE22572 [Exaiptasia diaphana]|nr:hypothetical protein AC249_AIPGENE22572 [Exaiptasia diaphana]
MTRGARKPKKPDTEADESLSDKHEQEQNEHEQHGAENVDQFQELKAMVISGFSNVNSKLDSFQKELKNEVRELKETIKGIEQSLDTTSKDLNDLRVEFGKETLKTDSEVKFLKEKITVLEERLNKEVEHNINLEQYTRRENLRFNNIDESPHEDCKAIVQQILEEDLELSISDIRFHAVHRVGKPNPNRTRPIIARFVCREDRDKVWSRRKKIKDSVLYSDPYITEDYAREIQKERRTLIQAMLKAKEQHGFREYFEEKRSFQLAQIQKNFNFFAPRGILYLRKSFHLDDRVGI